MLSLTWYREVQLVTVVGVPVMVAAFPVPTMAVMVVTAVVLVSVRAVSPAAVWQHVRV